VGEIFPELGGVVEAEEVGVGLLLLLEDSLILLLLCVGLKEGRGGEEIQRGRGTLRPCQGKEPRKKYINTKPKLSMSSRRLCSIPRCVLMEA
jgi:hypothetical protein